MDEAAQRFAEALVKSYKAIGDRSVSAQELNARLAQDFFDGVIDNLRAKLRPTGS